MKTLEWARERLDSQLSTLARIRAGIEAGDDAAALSKQLGFVGEDILSVVSAMDEWIANAATILKT
jgi:hypothetical protein